MASEDVLEIGFCSHRIIDRATKDAGTVEHLGHPLKMVRDVWSCRDCGTRFAPESALAAEVRELRKDKARLHALCKWVSERDSEFSVEELIAIADEELAAMGATEND